MWIGRVEIDEDNIDHVTRHGVSIADIEAVFTSNPTIRRNKSGRTGDYYAVARGTGSTSCIDPALRPISASRVR